MSIRFSDIRVRSSRAMLPGALLAVIALAVSSSSCESQSDEPPAPSSAAVADTADDRPVILLTGFEPFGGRPENVSWAGIKALNGQDFHGRRIVCREMPVVWGAPLTHLQEWTEELHPIAVFSFGEGRNAFDIETRASNQRGQIPDNDGATPSSASIVAEGPDQFDATIDHAELRQALAEQGHPVRVSTNAGRYLCEECLYSLEYLRATQEPDIDVMFCHVPPLGVEIEGERVTAEFVQDYVEDLLEIWYALSDLAELAAEAERQSGPAAAAADSRLADVESFINLYFSSWSDRDLDAYGDCFAPGSCVQYIGDNKEIRLYDLEPFLDLQADVHRRSRVRLTETPESIDIRFERELARVVVYWKLVAGSRTEFGYDHFTLLKDSDGWKIVNLVFYSTPPEAN